VTTRHGPIMQTGFVVRDLGSAMRHWTDALGVGPFWITEHVAFKEITYRSTPTPVDMSVAVAFSGDLQIELIQTHSEAPSIYRDHLVARGEGLQHVGVLVETFDTAVAETHAAGLEIIQAGCVQSGLRFAYLDTAGPLPGTMVELIEATPGMRKFLGRLKETARTWNGEEPVRKL
jgi:methylmalonyl-CoA/ethylmalonyl-CoA epimerase